jgi:hypothetical protein
MSTWFRASTNCSRTPCAPGRRHRRLPQHAFHPSHPGPCPRTLLRCLHLPPPHPAHHRTNNDNDPLTRTPKRPKRCKVLFCLTTVTPMTSHDVVLGRLRKATKQWSPLTKQPVKHHNATHTDPPANTLSNTHHPNTPAHMAKGRRNVRATTSRSARSAGRFSRSLLR